MPTHFKKTVSLLLISLVALPTTTLAALKTLPLKEEQLEQPPVLKARDHLRKTL